MSAIPDRRPATGIALGAALIGLGGLLLGLQVDANRAVCGTGLAPLGVGALLALAALAARTTSGRVPRDGLGISAVAAGFLGLAFAISGVLAPGGPWMFLEVLILVLVVALRRPDPATGRWIGASAYVLLALFLLFRLWVSYQGSLFRWQVVSVDVPVLSWLPFEFLEPVQRVALGSFTPHELGFPPAGLDFALSSALWALGFAACVGGLALLQASTLEHENDRVHALIRTLPAPLADVVERLLPEEEWRDLGLHGLPERRLARRVEALVAERIRRQGELARALEQSRLLARADPEGFAGGITRALTADVRNEERRA